MKKKRAKLQLTISILVSNNINTIKLCMESIKPLLQGIPSELIVVDTVGKEKSDGSLAVAEEYASLVVPFKWCDDFSAARNAGIKHARGEWFVFLDDDEWFDDVSAMIAFFKTGEYKKYSVAYYTQRNYRDFQGKTYTDVAIGRMISLQGGAYFIHPVHEQLEPFSYDACYLDCFVHHYGYCYKTIADIRKKSIRNITLLQGDLKKNPDNLWASLYLAREYLSDHDYDKAEEVIRHILYDLHDDKANFVPELNWLRCTYVNLLSVRLNHEKAIEEGEKFLLNHTFNDLTEGRLYLVLAQTNEVIKEWEKTLKYVYKYIEKYDILDENSNADKAQEKFEMNIKEMKSHVEAVVRRGIYSGLMLEQAEDITRILQWFWDKDIDKNIEILCIEQYKDISKEFDSVLTQCLSEINSKHNYILLNKLLASETKSVEQAQQAFNAYVEKKEFHTAKIAVILKIVSKQQLNIEELTSRINIFQWEVWLRSAYAKFSLLELEAFREITKQAVFHENEIKYQSFSRILEKYIILHKAEKEKELTWEDITIYCVESLKNDHTIYSELLFQEGNQVNLPEETQFLISLEESIAFQQKGQWADCLRTLKEALIICPTMKSVAECLLTRIKDNMAEKRNAEFDSLKDKLIQEMNRFIENGQRAEARMILINLKQFLPNDEALSILEERIRQM